MSAGSGTNELICSNLILLHGDLLPCAWYGNPFGPACDLWGCQQPSPNALWLSPAKFTSAEMSSDEGWGGRQFKKRFKWKCSKVNYDWLSAIEVDCGAGELIFVTAGKSYIWQPSVIDSRALRIRTVDRSLKREREACKRLCPPVGRQNSQAKGETVKQVRVLWFPWDQHRQIHIVPI